MNETQKKEIYAQKLRDAGIEFEVVGRYLSTPEGYRNQEFKCPIGHEVWGSRANMLKGKVKCPACPGDGQRRRSHEGYENELFEMEAKVFPVEKYAGALVPILHECIHGHRNLMRPQSVLRGSDCVECLGSKKYTNETFDQKLKDLGIFSHIRISHMNGIKHKTLFKCLNCEETWETLPSNVLAGSGCPYCAIHGFNKGKPGWLYYVKLTKGVQVYYKLGVTNKDPNKRFKNSTDITAEFLKLEYFDRGANAYFKEQQLMIEHKEFRVTDKEFLPHGGYTELFNKDILGLDDAETSS